MKEKCKSLPEGACVPRNYAVQDGCHNCGWVFRMHDYDSPHSYYCTYDAPERPDCGSVAMKESFFSTFVDGKRVPHKEGSLRFDLWYSWAAGRNVNPAGGCPCHCGIIVEQRT